MLASVWVVAVARIEHGPRDRHARADRRARPDFSVPQNLTGERVTGSERQHLSSMLASVLVLGPFED